MKLSTGKIPFWIEFDNGDKDCIYFNPNDPDFALRLTDFQSRIEKRVAETQNMELGVDGEPKNKDLLEEFRGIKNILCEEMDHAFGGDISAVVFKHCSPFAIINGDYFVLQFLEGISPEIEEHIKKANADVEKKMAKHLDKYKK